jgi:predicted metalloprotease with PDZ domain
MSEDDLAAVLRELTGRAYTRELARWVHGTGELPIKPLLAQHGVLVHEDPAQAAQRLGLRVAENHAIQIKTVLRGGAAEQAGFAAGDEWLGVAVGTGAQASHWRLHKLDELALYAGQHKRVLALVARDKQLLTLPLTLPQAVTTWRLSVRDPLVVQRWLVPGIRPA